MRFIHLLAMDGYVRWRAEAEPYLPAFYAEHCNGHFVTNLHGLPWTSGQNEHGASLDLICSGRRARLAHPSAKRKSLGRGHPELLKLQVRSDDRRSEGRRRIGRDE